MVELPDLESTSLTREHAKHARDGTLTLQTCSACGRPQYPYRAVCRYCLCDDLPWSRMSGSGKVIAGVEVYASLHPFFRQRAPWPICSVLLDAGPAVIAHVVGAAITSGTAVVVSDQHVNDERCVLMAARRVKTSDEEAR